MNYGQVVWKLLFISKLQRMIIFLLNIANMARRSEGLDNVTIKLAMSEYNYNN